MRLANITIENFRCYSAPFTLKFDDLTAIVGKNDAGKSAVMDALAIFFEEASLEQDDGCKLGNPAELKITCSFDDLPSSIVLDETFATSLASEHLLDADGRLTIRKSFNASLGKPKATSIEAICLHPAAEGFHDLLSLKKVELTKRATDLGVDLSEVNKAANAPIRAAIWASCEDLQKREAHISLEKESGKQVWAALVPYLPAFALFKSDRASTDQDAEAQDPLKAAIREAIKGVEEQLKQVQEQVESEVRKIAAATVEKIKQMDPTLAQTLDPIISTKKWDSLFQTSLTGDLGIPINKRGSGVKRLILLNFFRAKAEQVVKEREAPSVIYAIEEPETSQHPHNQRMLLAALTEIASHPGQQVIITTHTPMLARGLQDSCIRFIEADAQGARTLTIGGEATNEKIARSLGVLPDHSVDLFLGVEGKHDISFLRGISRLLVGEGLPVPNLEMLELDDRIIFFPLGGSNLALWSSRLKALNRPEYHLCDRDQPPPAQPKYHAYMAEVNARDGCTAVCTTRRELENYLHPDAIREVYQSFNINVVIPNQFNDFDDVPAIVAEAAHVATGGGPWIAIDQDARAKKTSRAKAHLNGPVVARMTAARLNAVDPNGEVVSWLTDIQGLLN